MSLTPKQMEFLNSIMQQNSGQKYSGYKAKQSYKGGQRQKEGRKYSGAKYHSVKALDKDNKPTIKEYVTGWYRNKFAGMVGVIAFPYHGTTVVTTAKGREYETWVAKITYESGVEKIRPCLRCLDTNKVFITGENMAILPKANNGNGWFGKLKPGK